MAKIYDKNFHAKAGVLCDKSKSGISRLYGLGLRLIPHNLATIQQQLGNNSATVTQQLGNNRAQMAKKVY